MAYNDQCRGGAILMGLVYLDDGILTNIADSIRSQLSTQASYYPEDMPSAIDSISGGGGGGSIKVDNFEWPMYTTSSTTSVNIGFTPKQLVIWTFFSSSASLLNSLIIYDIRFSTTKFVYAYNYSKYSLKDLNLTPSSSNYFYLYTIDEEGFTVIGSPQSGTIGYYFAIG